MGRQIPSNPESPNHVEQSILHCNQDLKNPSRKLKLSKIHFGCGARATRDQGQEDASLHAFSGHVVLEKLLHLPVHLLSLINPIGIMDIRTFYVCRVLGETGSHF